MTDPQFSSWSTGLLVVAGFVWALYRLWLGQELRQLAGWSRRLDALGLGAWASAGLLVVARVVHP